MQDLDFDIIKIPARSQCYGDRCGASINAIIVHCFGLSLEDMFKQLDVSQISTHYLVPQITAVEFINIMPKICEALGLEYQEPAINHPNQVPVIQLVADEYKAFHAGKSNFAKFNLHPACAQGLNASSLGIEFHAPGYANGDGSNWYKFTSYNNAQKATGIKLIKYLVQTHDIPKSNILAHSTIAVKRKTDPGPLFFWDDLYQAGFGYVPDRAKSVIFDHNTVVSGADAVCNVQNRLRAIGFNGCPEHGILDDETCANIEAYILQFASYLWREERSNIITQGLLSSLDNFDTQVFNMAQHLAIPEILAAPEANLKLKA